VTRAYGMVCFELLLCGSSIRRYFQVSAFEDQWYFFAFLMMALMLREGFCLEAGFDTPNSYATALAEKEQYLVNKGLR
jgi:hypothetical protein